MYLFHIYLYSCMFNNYTCVSDNHSDTAIKSSGRESIIETSNDLSRTGFSDRRIPLDQGNIQAETDEKKIPCKEINTDESKNNH